MGKGVKSAEEYTGLRQRKNEWKNNERKGRKRLNRKEETRNRSHKMRNAR
jgi:hypothetical protein